MAPGSVPTVAYSSPTITNAPTATPPTPSGTSTALAADACSIPVRSPGPRCSRWPRSSWAMCRAASPLGHRPYLCREADVGTGVPDRGAAPGPVGTIPWSSRSRTSDAWHSWRGRDNRMGGAVAVLVGGRLVGRRWRIRKKGVGGHSDMCSLTSFMIFSGSL
jgi:hypothetical protein